MDMVGGYGGLFVLNGQEAECVGTFLNWSVDESGPQAILTCDELFMARWPVKPPLHIALFSGGALVLGDSVGVPVLSSGEEIKADFFSDDDFKYGPFSIAIGYLYNRVPPFTAKSWKETVVERGRLVEVLKMVTQQRLKSGKGEFGLLEIEDKKERIGAKSQGE